MKVTAVDRNSTAQEIGIEPGDHLVRINGERVRDVLDYRYLITDELVELEVKRNGESTVYEIEKDVDDSLGLNFSPLKIRRCGNDCIFCFVDQNPAGMRSAMYFRDEDFRLSFLSGHYVTLSNISQADLQRIVRQRLTPLFVSVHATEPAVRKFLLGIDFDDRLLDKIAYLTENGIELNTQIVLCPGINDGAVLRRTIWDLAKHYPRIKSVAIVPVGLTRHREGLTKIEPVTKEYALDLLQIADRYASEWKAEIGTHFVYPSDEFYILAETPLPPAERYDAFDQMENGVGMLRDLKNDFDSRQKPLFPRSLPEPRKLTMVSATLAGGFIRENILPGLECIANLHVELVILKNKFYGDSITVTGLLTGGDIFNSLRERDLGDAVILPKSCLNEKNTFLDDWKLDDLQQRLGVPVHAIKNDFSLIFDHLG